MRMIRGLTVLFALAFAPDLLPGSNLAMPLFGNPAIAQEATDVNINSSSRMTRVWDQAAAWIWAKHHQYQHALTRELRNIKGQDGIGWALVLASFLYGMLHAAGPGHGKAVLTTYLITHKDHLTRGVAMGVAAAFMQGLTALLVVYGLVGIAGWLPEETESASLWVTRLSFAMVAILGLYLLFRVFVSLRGLIQRARFPVHAKHDAHIHGDDCGCRHLPNTQEIDAGGSAKVFIGVVLSIGLRPCSGALLVLILSVTLNLVWHGALAVLAMSLGTAITIVALAVVATKARELASSFVADRSPLWSLAGIGVGILGGGLLLFLGIWLLSISFSLNSTLG
ncbi:MAG: nickel/cobalt transporter [Pseudomonadota bacterium]